jgi:hypothetical protein
MVKAQILRKNSVIKDELKLHGSGLYCFLPFENSDKNGKSVYKIGLTIKQVHERVEQYHSYFPMGVYVVCALLAPTKLKRKRTQTVYYQEIEEYLFDEVERHGGNFVYSTTRIKKGGKTEWVYANETIIHEAFDEAAIKYGGRLHLFNTKGKNQTSKSLRAVGPHFLGEIVYPLSKK